MLFCSLIRRSRKSAAKFILVVLLGLSAANASDEDKILRFSIPPNGWPPYVITAGEQSFGMMVDVVREITARLGYKLEISVVPEKRMLMLMAKGQIEAWPKSPEWVKDPGNFHWTGPIIDVSDYLVYAKGSGQTYNSADDLKGKRIGTILGFGYPTLESKFDQGLLKRVDVYTPRQMLGMVARGRVDAAIINKHVAQWLIKTNDSLQVGDFEFSRAPIDTTGYALMLNQGSNLESFIEAFNRELGLMRADGTLSSIFSKYQ